MSDFEIQVEDRIILRSLFSSNGELNVYELHKKYLLSPGQISRSLRKLSSLDIISMDVENAIFEITENGREIILFNRRELFGRPLHKVWQNIPEEMLVAKVEQDMPYLPRKFRK